MQLGSGTSLQYRGECMSPELLKNTVALFLDKLGVVVEDISITTNQRTIVAVTIKEAELAIGPRGEHLRAINTVVRRLVEQQPGVEAATFLIDINNYHEDQMEAVRQNARMLAQRARLFKHDVEMEPMNPYERLVVHELFAEDPQIQTVSEGEGKFRHIVLKIK